MMGSTGADGPYFFLLQEQLSAVACLIFSTLRRNPVRTVFHPRLIRNVVDANPVLVSFHVCSHVEQMKWSSPIKSLPKNMQPWPFAP